MFQIRVGSELVDVLMVVSRSYSADFIYVRVELADNRLALLRYDANLDRWTVALLPVRRYDKQHAPSSRRGDPTWPQRIREEAANEGP